jgi:4-amino-4-deoxy-L-arabinose transferase-like glycosyltransferase
MRHKLVAILLLVIILIGAYLRLDGDFKNLFAFTYDVGRDMLALSNIVHAHKISLIGFTTGLPGVFYGPWWYIILLPFYVISGGNPQGIAFSMAFLGIVTILLGYFFGKKIGGVFLGLSFAGLVSVSPLMISLSTQIWNPNISPLFIVFTLLALYKIYSEKIPQSRYFFIIGFLLALISDLEIVFGFMLLIGVILSVIVVVNKKISLKAIISFIFGAVVIYSPRIIFEFRHQFLMTKAFIKFLTVGDSSQKMSLIGTFIDRVNILFAQFNSAIALENKILGLIIILFILLVIIVFYKKASSISKQFVKTSLIVLLTFLFGLTLFRHAIFSHYLVGLPVIYLLLLSLAVNFIVQKTRSCIIPGLIVVIIFLINFNPIAVANNFSKPIFIGDASVYRNKLAVIDYVYQQSDGKQFKYVVYTRAVYNDVYQYLFKWYGQKKYHYSPSKDAHLAYFILEQDPQYPFDLNDWLKVREKDGKIIKTEKFKSGIIVQTRVH